MDATQLVQRYLDTWNEQDAEARRSAVASLWTEDARYVDPLASVAGPDAISELIGAVQAQARGFEFRLANGVDAHHDVVRFGWELVPASGGEPLAIGVDVAVTTEDGRIAQVLGFLDKAPTA